MLISRVSEDESGKAGDVEQRALESNSTEYQTADELFEIIAKDHPFKIDGDKELTTRDLVILYKNIDIGTKLIQNSNVLASKCPNQYVETIIYNDERESEDSDISDDISNEDFNDVFMINKERIDLFNNIGDSLCHKFGNINMQTSNLTTDYDKHFFFENQFIKEQLKSFHTISKSKLSDSTVLPASLLDYICCKRLEDNYNFYLDNIIKYVHHTIEQLKRISNGDYLTERAKERWRKVDGNINILHTTDSKKIVLASSTSIPMHVEGKRSGYKSTWDDIVHSEMDVRSLARILEKKIIVEVPKIICGSYTLFSKRHKENLIITCKKRKQHVIAEAKEKESRVDVVLKLQRSKSGHVISNIDSIMILKSLPNTESGCKDILALEFEQVTNHVVEQNAKIVELNDNIEKISQHNIIENDLITDQECKDEEITETISDFSRQYICDEQNSSCSLQTEANFSAIVADDLHCTLHRLNMQSPVLEEYEDNNKKKKSPTRVRIKSPYENQSHLIEEKKRQKLLEIREKREKKKVAMSENCKITKHRYGRGAIMAQPSNSVTKLSITNKSFYNSIYGQTVNINNKNSKKSKDQKMEYIPALKLEHNEEDDRKDISTLTTPEKNSQKYINRSYYLDEADTEIMYLQSPEDESNNEIKDTCTPSTSVLFTDDVGGNLLKQLIGTSTTEFTLTDTSSSLQENVVFEDNFINIERRDTRNKVFTSKLSTQVPVPTNTPKKENVENASCKISSSIECKRSIDKIYQLIKNNNKANCDLKSKSKLANNIDKLDLTAHRRSSTVQFSDSGTSIKHQLTSSNPSCVSFEKTNIGNKPRKDSKKKYEQSTSVIPKVIISSKLQNNKNGSNKINNKENKRLTLSKVPENPLKAISQLLHEFDSIQKTRHKNVNELKRNKKSEGITIEDKSNSKPTFFKRTPKQDQLLNSSLMFKERRRPGLSTESSRIPHQEIQYDEKYVDKTGRKKISDIIDEVKELRGEAVRGPSKKLSRLNSLAQPKKAYVQAHHDDIQNRFGKRIVERLHKPPTAPTSVPERTIGSINLKNKQRKEGFPGSTNKLNIAGQQALENLSRTKRSRHNSPSPDGKNSPVPGYKPSYNNSNVKNPLAALNGKMVAVETYVKNHFGRVSQAQEPGENYVHKSRVPLIPIDIDVASLTSSRSIEESSVLGKKLHYMIDSVINTNAPILSAVTECNESTSKFDNDDPEDIFTEDLLKNEEAVSGSDYPVDVFQDKNIITAVSTICKNNKDNEVKEKYKNTNVTMCETIKSCTNELQTLENALYRQISNSVFQKRLRIKNLTLTPKQSMDNVFILPSGDAASLLVKSTFPQKKIAKTDTLSELTILPVLSNNRIDFGVTKIPMHIATVGYAFSHYLMTSHSLTETHYSNKDSKKSDFKNYNVSNDVTFNLKLIKSIQCFKSAAEKTPQDTIKEKTNVCSDTDIRHKYLNTSEYIQNQAENIEKKGEVKVSKTGTEIRHDDEIHVKNKNNDISYSTSLDILVGLLNEIKKITSHQADLTKTVSTCNIDLESKELEIILDKAAVKESSVDHSINNGLSLSSLDNLEGLETSSSKYSVKLSSNVEEWQDEPTMHKDITTSISLPYGILSVNKEINASLRIYQKEYVHKLTEVQSQFFPVTVSTNVTESLIRLIKKSSKNSIYCFNDCQSSDNSTPNVIKEMSNTEQCVSHPALEIHYLKDTKNHRVLLKGNAIKSNTHVAVAKFDPIMKMKRDILVTVYSILVLTVFAALSFSEFAYV